MDKQKLRSSDDIITEVNTKNETAEFAAGELGEIQRILFGKQTQAQTEQISQLRQHIDERVTDLSETCQQQIAKLGTDVSTDIDALKSAQIDRKQLTQLRVQLNAIERRLSDRDARTRDTSDVLVNAVRTRLATDDKLGNALKPVVVEQFRQTSKDDPEIMAEALFPILGPAIRKMIAAMLTPDAKTKKRTYRLEQLFLIEKETGLPICHVASDTAVTKDADMVSGMLSAIQSFVHDAFATNDFDGLNTLQVGELSVWIEWGPSAILAAVIRGVGPEKLREAMQLQLEDIHHSYANQLMAYDGNAAPFDPIKPELHQFLDGHDGTLKNKVKKLPARAKRWLVGTGIALLCLVGWMLYQVYDSARWNRYVASIEAEPGIVVTKSDKGFRHYVLHGLKDPKATDPTRLLSETTINPDLVTHHFEPYQAIHADFVLARARALLEPPPDVNVSLVGSTLHVSSGNAMFVAKALRLGPLIVGIDRVSVRK